MAVEYADEVLAGFEVLQSDDPVKTDLELTCSTCREHVCDVEAGDTLDVLAASATDHECKPRDFEATVTVTCRSRHEAALVLAERLNCDEDYGFEYSVGYGEVREADDGQA